MGGLVFFVPPIYHVWRYAFNVVAWSSIIKVLHGDQSVPAIAGVYTAVF